MNTVTCICVYDKKMMRCDQITIFHYVNDRFLFCLDTYRGIRAKMICDANALEWCGASSGTGTRMYVGVVASPVIGANRTGQRYYAVIVACSNLR